MTAPEIGSSSQIGFTSGTAGGVVSDSLHNCSQLIGRGSLRSVTGKSVVNVGNLWRQEADYIVRLFRSQFSV
jgi:hypothetical protein